MTAEETMKSNVGPLDQWVRVSVGFVLLFLAGSGLVGAWGYIGVVPLATAALRYCPLYHLLGIDTMHRARHKRSGPPTPFHP
jgi:hypothetical protein